MNSQKEPIKKEINFSWGTFPIILTAVLTFFTLAGIFLYAFGQAAEQSYLSSFGLDHKWFEWSKEMKIYLGYELLLGKLAWLLKFLILLIALSSLSVIYQESKNPNQNTRESLSFRLGSRFKSKLNKMIGKDSSFSQRLVGNTFLVSIVASIVLLFAASVLHVMQYPIREGGNQGRLKAVNLIMEIHEHDGIDSKLIPVSVKKNGTTLIYGYPVAYGENHVAIYNKQTRTIHTFSTDEIEITRAFPKEPILELPPPGDYGDPPQASLDGAKTPQ